MEQSERIKFYYVSPKQNEANQNCIKAEIGKYEQSWLMMKMMISWKMKLVTDRSLTSFLRKV